MQKLLRHTARKWRAHLPKISPAIPAGSNTNCTADTAETTVIRLNDMPQGKIEVLDDNGKWNPCDEVDISDLGNNNVRLTFHRPLPALSGLIFRVQKNVG